MDTPKPSSGSTPSPGDGHDRGVASEHDGFGDRGKKNQRPADLFEYLSEKDPSGFKYRVPFDQQVEMYRFAIDRLDRKKITPALCKEDVSVWKAVLIWNSSGVTAY